MAKRPQAVSSPALRQQTLAGPPLDFSFKELTSLDGASFSGCALVWKA